MAKRRAAALALATVLFVGLALPAHAQDVQAGRFALGQFDVPCRAAILDLIEESGTVLYEKEADTRMPDRLHHQGDDPASGDGGAGGGPLYTGGYGAGD